MIDISIEKILQYMDGEDFRVLKKLVKCKSFKDIYESFGERGFSNGAGRLLKLFLISPLIAGVKTI